MSLGHMPDFITIAKISQMGVVLVGYHGVPSIIFPKRFDKWVQRLCKCITTRGDYFEQLRVVDGVILHSCMCLMSIKELGPEAHYFQYTLAYVSWGVCLSCLRFLACCHCTHIPVYYTYVPIKF